MKRRLKRDMIAMMKANGYTLVRRTRHLVWSNGSDVVVTAKSPSDYRAILNARGEVRRAARRRSETA